MKKGLFLKISFYIISLNVLFVLVAIVSARDFNGLHSFVQAEFYKSNIISIISMICAIISIGIAKGIEYQWNGTLNLPYKVISVKNENYEYLTFLTTYIIPLVTIDFLDVRYLVAFVSILILTGVIFIKTDLYYGNPTLALLGYRLYRVCIEYQTETKKEVVVITKNKLSHSNYIAWISLDDNVWMAKVERK